VPSRSAVPETRRIVRAVDVEAVPEEDSVEEDWWGDSNRHSQRGWRVIVRVLEPGGGFE